MFLLNIQDELVDKALEVTVENAVAKPATTVGQAIDGLLLAVFSPLIKYDIKKGAEIEAYKQKIINEVSKVPDGNLIDPPLCLVGPALEASKYYIEEDVIRNMFAKLIASSMNSETQPKAHPSFVEIIKQLSPLDASNLKIIAENTTLPLAEYQLHNSPKEIYTTQYTNVFLSNPISHDISVQAASITNLVRLGLVHIDYEKSLVDCDYSVFKKEPIYIDLSRNLASRYPDDSGEVYDTAKIINGTVTTTPLGEIFTSLCL